MPRYSVIIPAYNAESTIVALMESLQKQIHKDFEVIVVDDGSVDHTPGIVATYPCHLIQNQFNKGPAHCRNMGVSKARGSVLVFTDSDCIAAPEWLANLDTHCQETPSVALMGKLEIMPSTYLGESISALGFPAGGTIGFEKIWRVDPLGFTSSLSTCNCAVHKKVFTQAGGFDESFPYAGGEDTLLAYNLRRMGHRIKYCQDVVMFHPARDSMRSFIKWQFKRGISSYLFAKKISSKGDFLSLRLWSTKNIVKTYLHDPKFPLIATLLIASFAIQFYGYTYAHHKRSTLCAS